MTNDYCAAEDGSTGCRPILSRKRISLNKILPRIGIKDSLTYLLLYKKGQIRKETETASCLIFKGSKPNFLWLLVNPSTILTEIH